MSSALSPKNQDRKHRIKINFSEPILLPEESGESALQKDGSMLIPQNEELQMSCIVSKNSNSNNEENNSQSDRISQEDNSLSEIETFLESL